MKQPTVKYPSGLEVNLAAFLLKMTSPGIGQARTPAIHPERSGLQESGATSSHSQREEKDERQAV